MKLPLYMAVLVLLITQTGCVQGMGAITNTLANLGNGMMYSSNGTSLHSNGETAITHNGVRYGTGRSGTFYIDNGSYSVGNGAGGYIKTPSGFINGSKLRIGDFKFF